MTTLVDIDVTDYGETIHRSEDGDDDYSSLFAKKKFASSEKQ